MPATYPRCTTHGCFNQGRYHVENIPGNYCGTHKKTAIKDHQRTQLLALLAIHGIPAKNHVRRDEIVVNVTALLHIFKNIDRWKTFYESFDDNIQQEQMHNLLTTIENL